jgi:hypothetical protein
MKALPFLIAALLYLLFLAWHEPLFLRPLAPGVAFGEAAAALQHLDSAPGVSASEKAAIRAFFAHDDGRPFMMVNLMRYRDVARYATPPAPLSDPVAPAFGKAAVGLISLFSQLLRSPSHEKVASSGSAPLSGRDAAARYYRVVVPILLRRGCYPLFASTVLAPFLSNGGRAATFSKRWWWCATAASATSCR